MMNTFSSRIISSSIAVLSASRTVWDQRCATESTICRSVLRDHSVISIAVSWGGDLAQFRHKLVHPDWSTTGAHETGMMIRMYPGSSRSFSPSFNNPLAVPVTTRPRKPPLSKCERGPTPHDCLTNRRKPLRYSPSSACPRCWRSACLHRPRIAAHPVARAQAGWSRARPGSSIEQRPPRSRATRRTVE